jgi:hypothetical protein
VRPRGLQVANYNTTPGPEGRPVHPDEARGLRVLGSSYMRDEVRRVWVLGAGFSKPLGGPLLRDLFRMEARGSALLLYPEKLYPGLARTLWDVQRIFNRGREGRSNRWSDAESFLATVDAAYRNDMELTYDLESFANRGRYRYRFGVNRRPLDRLVSTAAPLTPSAWWWRSLSATFSMSRTIDGLGKVSGPFSAHRHLRFQRALSQTTLAQGEPPRVRPGRK